MQHRSVLKHAAVTPALTLAVIGAAVIVSASEASATSGPAPRPAATAAESPAQIISAARAATLGATDVTITVREQIDGANAAVLITGRYPTYVKEDVSVAGASEGLVVDGSHTYFEASAAIWQESFKLSAVASRALAGKWYETTDSDPLIGASAANVNPTALERSLFTSLRAIAGAKGLAVRTGSVGGRSALIIGDKDGAVYVAATGKPFLLRITSNTATDKGFAEFNNYDAPLHPVLPAVSGDLDTAYAAAVTAAPTATTAAPTATTAAPTATTAAPAA